MNTKKLSISAVVDHIQTNRQISECELKLEVQLEFQLEVQLELKLNPKSVVRVTL